MLANFAPKPATFKANLIGGRTVEITLRPFTLGDKAWMENTFRDDAQKIMIASMEVEPWSRIIWHQMTPESRDIFMRIRFTKVDETTNEPIDFIPEGYQRFMEALFSVTDLLAAVEAFNKCQTENGFEDDGVKKKKMGPMTQTSGSRFMTLWRRLMGLPLKNS